MLHRIDLHHGDVRYGFAVVLGGDEQSGFAVLYAAVCFDGSGVAYAAARSDLLHQNARRNLDMAVVFCLLYCGYDAEDGQVRVIIYLEHHLAFFVGFQYAVSVGIRKTDVLYLETFCVSPFQRACAD